MMVDEGRTQGVRNEEKKPSGGILGEHVNVDRYSEVADTGNE